MPLNEIHISIYESVMVGNAICSVCTLHKWFSGGLNICLKSMELLNSNELFAWGNG